MFPLETLLPEPPRRPEDARMRTTARLNAACALLFVTAALFGCSYVAVRSAPAKEASDERTEAALKADELFWRTLHAGEYEEIPAALNALTGAYLENPNDAVTAAHIGWLHIWRLAESSRLDQVPPTVTHDAILARRYFQEAVQLNPDDARYLGFLASATMAEGSIHKDERLTRRGYFLMQSAVRAWPEFNLFTAGYGASRLPRGSERFSEALERQWRTLDLCSGEKIDRTNPDFGKYMSLATNAGPKRACWNSSIAPHNFEGFFLNMGDMLVKSGDWQTARKIYANARSSPTYAQWKFRDVLEARIGDAEANVAEFSASRDDADKTRTRMMVASPFACMACHQS
jgi:tetratricopeptide (TPR) repeat protein